MPSPPDLKLWHSAVFAYLERAQEDLISVTARFLDDWHTVNGFRYLGHPQGRIKSPERIWAKLQAKARANPAVHLGSFDELLCEDSLVGDLVGARVVLRGLRDVEQLVQSISENDFLNDGAYLLREIDDKIARPSATGYRAVHLNASVSVHVRNRERLVPVELQIKTGLQDNWGSFTHDLAYERLDLHADPSFARLRDLQRLLADSLDIADQLNRSVEGFTRIMRRLGNRPVKGSP